MNWGLDYLGGAMYQDVILREHPQGWAAGTFFDTFGDCMPMVNNLLKTGRCPVFRFNGPWTKHAYNPAQHKARIVECLKQANQTQKRFPGVNIQFAPVCESDVDLTQLMKELDGISKVTLVNSVFKGKILQGRLNEVHGGKAQRPKGKYNWSGDGSNCFDLNIGMLKEKHKTCSTFYLWCAQFNLVRKEEPEEGEVFPPPLQRKFVPVPKLVDALIYLHNNGGDFKLGGDQIWKPCSDQQTVIPGPRELKPVFITTTKANRIELVADNGQVVAVTGGPEPYSGGGWRYYLGEWGFIVAEKAIRIQGHPIVRLRACSQMLGRVNPAFRCGTFR